MLEQQFFWIYDNKLIFRSIEWLFIIHIICVICGNTAKVYSYILSVFAIVNPVKGKNILIVGTKAILWYLTSVY